MQDRQISSSASGYRRPEKHRRDLGDHRHGKHIEFDLAQPAQEMYPDREKIMIGGLAESKDMFQPTGGDQDGRARCETDNDGMGDEIDKCPQPGQAKGQLIDPGQKGQGKNQPNVLLGTGLGKRADGAEDNDGDSRGRPGYQMQGRAEERGDNGSDNGGVEAVFRGKTFTRESSTRAASALSSSRRRLSGCL